MAWNHKTRVVALAVAIQPVAGVFTTPTAADIIPVSPPTNGEDIVSAEDPTATGTAWAAPRVYLGKTGSVGATAPLRGPGGSAPFAAGAWPLGRVLMGAGFAEVRVPVAVSGTAQAGGTTTSINLAPSTSAIDDFYVGMPIQHANIGSGTIKSVSLITDFNGTSRAAALAETLGTAPTSGAYTILPNVTYQLGTLVEPPPLLSVSVWRDKKRYDYRDVRIESLSFDLPVANEQNQTFPSIEFAMKGLPAGVSDEASPTVPSSTLTSIPPFRNGKFTLDRVKLGHQSTQFQLSAEVAGASNAAAAPGQDGYEVMSATRALSLDLNQMAKTDFDIDTRVDNQTVLPCMSLWGMGPGNRFGFCVPEVMLDPLNNPGDRNGFVNLTGNAVFAGVDKSATLTLFWDAVAAVPLKVLFVGSSTPDKYFTEFTGVSNPGVTRSTNGTTFTSSNAGIGAVTYGNRLNDLLGVPIKLLDLGVAGSSIKEWDDNTSTTAYRTPAVAASIAAGGVDCAVLICGFNDAKQGLITSVAVHAARVRSLISKLRSELGQPNLKIILGMSQNDYSSGASAQDVGFNYLHAAEQLIAENDANVFFGANSWDLSQLADGIHQTETAYPVHATRLADNTVNALQGVSTNMGPTITGVTGLTYTTTELTITHDGGSDITPASGYGGFVVMAGATPLAISSSVRTAANKIVLTHATNGGTPVTVTHQAGASPTKTPSLRDDGLHAGFGQPAQHVSLGLTAASAGDPPAAIKSAQINFRSNVTTRVNTSNPAGWNGLTASEDAPSSDIGATSTTGMSLALLTPAGDATGWTITTTQPARGASNNTMTGSQTMPADVANSWWANGDSGVTPANARIPSTTHTISGLNPAKNYKLGFYGRRETTTARQTKYTAGGQSVTQTNNQNNGGVTEITGLSPDAGGNLTYTFEPAGTAAFGYLNGVIITEL